MTQRVLLCRIELGGRTIEPPGNKDGVVPEAARAPWTVEQCTFPGARCKDGRSLGARHKSDHALIPGRTAGAGNITHCLEHLAKILPIGGSLPRVPCGIDARPSP